MVSGLNQDILLIFVLFLWEIKNFPLNGFSLNGYCLLPHTLLPLILSHIFFLACFLSMRKDSKYLLNTTWILNISIATHNTVSKKASDLWRKFYIAGPNLFLLTMVISSNIAVVSEMDCSLCGEFTCINSSASILPLSHALYQLFPTPRIAYSHFLTGIYNQLQNIWD